MASGARVTRRTLLGGLDLALVLAGWAFAGAAGLIGRVREEAPAMPAVRERGRRAAAMLLVVNLVGRRRPS